MSKTFQNNLNRAKKNLGIADGGLNTLVPIAFGFINHGHHNESGEDPDSLIIILDAIRLNKTVRDTLPDFAELLEAVINNPDGKDHPNIRSLIKYNKEAYVGSIVTLYGKPVQPKPVSG